MDKLRIWMTILYTMCAVAHFTTYMLMHENADNEEFVVVVSERGLAFVVILFLVMLADVVLTDHQRHLDETRARLSA